MVSDFFCPIGQPSMDPDSRGEGPNQCRSARGVSGTSPNVRRRPQQCECFQQPDGLLITVCRETPLNRPVRLSQLGRVFQGDDVLQHRKNLIPDCYRPEKVARY